MVFYCPNCQKEYEVEPANTITTLQNRTAYKANCPVCGQDMAEFLPPSASTVTPLAVSPNPVMDTPIPPSSPLPQNPIVSNLPPANEEQAVLNQAADALSTMPIPPIVSQTASTVTPEPTSNLS
jgi:hypothetical protein